MKDEMDILKEVGTIAAGHASIALSEILGSKIGLTTPDLDIIPSDTIFKKIECDQLILSVNCHMLSGLKGDILFILSEESSFKLIDICYKNKDEQIKTGVLTEMGMSVIKEVGSIVVSSYIGALSMLLRKVIIPSVPTLLSGTIKEIISFTMTPYVNKDNILLAKVVFEDFKDNIKGSFYLILNSEAIREIQDSCKKTLELLQ
jgi:chemotaxis protein CheC